MNEVDLYVELIDDKTASRILKEFSETVPGFKSPNLQQKKAHIRNIFKGQTTNIRKKRGVKGNPLYSHLSNYKSQENDELFGKMDAKTMFRVLYSNKMIPDYIKFALAQLYQLEALKEKLPLMVQNLEENKPLFAFETGFETQEEAERYLRENSRFIGEEGLNLFLIDLKKHFAKDELECLVNLEKIISELTLLEFENKKYEFYDEPEYLLYYAFLATHPELTTDIRLGMILHVAYTFAKEYRLKDDLVQSRFEQLELDIKLLTQNLADYEMIKEKAKEYDRDKRLFEKEKKESSVLIQNLNNEMTSLSNEYVMKMDTQKQENERVIKELKLEFQELQNQLNISKQKVENINFEFSGESPFQEFAVVYTGENELFRQFFPEIVSFPLKDWNQKKNILTKFTKVFFQRDGLNSSMIYNIQEYCAKNKIEPKYFIARNMKELFERISHEKFQLLEV